MKHLKTISGQPQAVGRNENWQEMQWKQRKQAYFKSLILSAASCSQSSSCLIWTMTHWSKIQLILGWCYQPKQQAATNSPPSPNDPALINTFQSVTSACDFKPHDLFIWVVLGLYLSSALAVWRAKPFVGHKLQQVAKLCPESTFHSLLSTTHRSTDFWARTTRVDSWSSCVLWPLHACFYIPQLAGEESR